MPRAIAVAQLELQFPGPKRKARTPAAAVPIDTAFPEKEADALAMLECFNKHLFRPNTYLHKWWARRSGTTFRYILKQLAPDADLRSYYAAGGLEGFTILDPMMGGGTTLHEAIRMEASVIGYDLDPIPALQARASLCPVPLADKERVFVEFLSHLEKRIGTLFQTKCPICNGNGEIQFMLYGVRKSCGCGEVVVVDALLLREEPDGRHKRFEDFYPTLEVKQHRKRWPIVEKAKAQCDACGQPFVNVLNVRFAERYVPLVVAGGCQSHGQFFKAVDTKDLTRLTKARKAAERVVLPREELFRVPDGPKSGDLLTRKVEFFSDLFSPRQLMYVTSAKEFLEGVEDRHRLWLAMLVSTSLEFNSMLCGYKGTDKRRPGAIRHVFSHHAYSFPHTSLESNPVFSGRSSGTLRRLFEDRVRDASRWAGAPVERKPIAGDWRKVIIFGETDAGVECSSIAELTRKARGFIVEQRDSSRLPLPIESVDFVVTDPPYFDSVQYSDLSHFFRAWLRWFLPTGADWHFVPAASAVAETGDQAKKFTHVLAAIWRECNRVLRRPHGRLIFTYHHWRADAWINLTLALKSAGFRLLNSYVIHSENPISVHIRHLKALKHDAILVLCPNDIGARKPVYSSPQVIETNDSAKFCRGCATLLGFCLDTKLADSEICRLWEAALGE